MNEQMTVHADHAPGPRPDLLAALVQARDVDAACKAALRAALTATGADQASVAVLEQDGQVRVRWSLRRDGKRSRTLGAVLAPNSIAAHALRSGKASLIADCESQWPVSPGMRLSRLRCIMAAPMRRSSGVRNGGILVGSRTPEAFGRADLAWTDAIATALALRLELISPLPAESA